MFYLSLIKDFGLEMDQTPLAFHRNCFCTFAVYGVMLLAISKGLVGVGL